MDQPRAPDRVSRSQAPRVVVALIGASVPVVVVLLVALLIASWSLTHLGGGAGVLVPHGYYLPVIVAAIRFGHRGAFVVAIVAGVMAGPLTSQLVDAQVAQAGSEWVSRTVAFVLVGQVVAWLLRYAVASMQHDARLARDDAELVRALRDGELSLRYQPIVTTADGSLVGFEALVRWDHPDGERGPDAFVPAAEVTGRIRDVGRFVLHTACEQAATWHRQAQFAGRHSPIVGVNVSAEELGSDTFVREVGAALTATGLPGRQLCLEVTEGALVADLAGSSRRLAALRELGVRIAVDDFGTGYSSLSYVHRFPLDSLKIDRSFVVEVDRSDRARALVGGIVWLCRRFGLTVVAEGIECPRQLELLRDLGCQLAQGYHLAAPATADRLEPWLARTAPLPGRADPVAPDPPAVAAPTAGRSPQRAARGGPSRP